MKSTLTPATGNVFLGLEGGGTRTVALAADSSGRALHRVETGPANLRLVTDLPLVRHLRFIRSQMPAPSSLAIGLAGARTEADRDRIRLAAQKVWPGIPCYATNDLETGLMAADPAPGAAARILIVCGTGSCCFGINAAGKAARVGGWGHILGDQSSGYDIGLRALKAVVHKYDCEQTWSRLGQKILRALQLNEPDDLDTWVPRAAKPDIAALAMVVFDAAVQHDKMAITILASAAEILAQYATACAKRLASSKAKVEFNLSGSVLLKQPAFARLVARQLRQLWPKAVVQTLERESVWGAVQLAKNTLSVKSPQPFPTVAPKTSALIEDSGDPLPDLQQLVSSPTEQRNPRSMNLDQLPLPQAIELMLSEESTTAAAVLAQREKLQPALQLVVRAFREGGRLFYVGAGTSGRLGVLDASECPPTFNTDPEMVQGIMAGGQRALWESVEGAEDDAAAGARALQFRAIGSRDVVLGIAASGRTPFVWGALDQARRRHAATILLTFNPNLHVPPDRRPDVIIAPNVGPEVLTGSTRLKAGTATKLVLNTITTLAMVQLGKVESNLMIDVKASNTKLRDRATRILQQLTGTDYQQARAVLAKCKWNIKTARQLLQR